MDRRQFLTSVAASVPLPLAVGHLHGGATIDPDRTFATPEEARRSPREQLAYVIGVYAGTGIEKPDYLATIDLDPASKTHDSEVVHRLPMPNVGDELHQLRLECLCQLSRHAALEIFDHSRPRFGPDSHRRHSEPGQT